MDNLTSHKTTEAFKCIQEDNVRVLFLPPYTPEYSAIESLFGNLK